MPIPVTFKIFLINLGIFKIVIVYSLTGRHLVYKVIQTTTIFSFAVYNYLLHISEYGQWLHQYRL